MVFDDTGFNMSNPGVVLEFPGGGSLRVCLGFGGLLADEAALHSTFSCKGSSGLKPCFLCQNIFSSEFGADIVATDTTGFAKLHTCTDASQLVLHTPETITAIINRLVAAAPPASLIGEFKEIQVRLGWTYAPDSIMFTRARRLINPALHGIYDWMHICFVSGVFNVHFGQLMAAVKCHGVTYAVMHDYIVKFRWPASVGTIGSEVFCIKRAKSSWDAGVLKASAS